MPRNGDVLATAMPVSAAFPGFSLGITSAPVRAARQMTYWPLRNESNRTVMVGFGRIARLGDREHIRC